MLTEDVFKYALEKKNKLLRQFIVYRISVYILGVLSTCYTQKLKAVFLLPDKIISQYFQKNEIFIYNTIRSLSQILSLSVMQTNLKLAEIQQTLMRDTGDGKELKVRICKDFVKLRLPNFYKFDLFLQKYKIHKLQGDISKDFKVKLGLFVA